MGKKKQGRGKATKKLKGPGGVSAGDKEELYKKEPHTFVFHRGQVGKCIHELMMDLRRVMEPFTASRLKVKKKNVLKDFVNIAGPLHVNHFIVLSRKEVNIQLRVVKLPKGPTLTFRLQQYSLSRDVISSIKHHNMEPRQFKHHPLLVMNNFSGDGMHFKLMSAIFQNMFPSINVSKVKLGEIRRCVLLNYDPEEQTVEFRHYNIRAVPVGMSKSIKKLVKARVPNLSRLDDVSDFLLRTGDLSESEAELDGDHNEVVLPQDVAGRGNVKSAKSAIRLTEIGPRMKLQLVKIEEGLGKGRVLYHHFVQKTEEELAALEKKRREKRQQKDKRKKQQEENVKKKQAKQEELKQKTLAGMSQKDSKESKETTDDSSSREDASEDDDTEYFRQEVGEDPEQGLFPKKKAPRKRKSSENNSVPFKRKRMTEKNIESSKQLSSKERKVHDKQSFKQKKGSHGKSRNTKPHTSVVGSKRPRPQKRRKR